MRKHTVYKSALASVKHPLFEFLKSLVLDAEDTDEHAANPSKNSRSYYIPEYRRGDPLSDPLRRLRAVMLDLDVVRDTLDATEMFVVKIALVLA